MPYSSPTARKQIARQRAQSDRIRVWECATCAYWNRATVDRCPDCGDTEARGGREFTVTRAELADNAAGLL